MTCTTSDVAHGEHLTEVRTSFIISQSMKIDFEKMGGLIPAIVQDYRTKDILMLGFMNNEAYEQTVKEGKVTFFSRTKNRLWTKGESSGNFLIVKELLMDCDKDTLLIKVKPHGPTCHTGNRTCFFKKTAIQ